MMTHVVLLRPRPETGDEDMLRALEHVRALQPQLPGLLSVSTGENRSRYHQGYRYGVIMRFVDQAHLETHHPHPAHVAVVEELERLCEHLIDFDLPENSFAVKEE